MSEKRIFARRLWMSLAGVVLTALAVAMFKAAALGVDPFQSFVTGTIRGWQRLSICFCWAIWWSFSRSCVLEA